MEKACGKLHHSIKGGACYSSLRALADLDYSHWSKVWACISSSMLFCYRQGMMAFSTVFLKAWFNPWSLAAAPSDQAFKFLCLSASMPLLSFVMMKEFPQPLTDIWDNLDSFNMTQKIRETWVQSSRTIYLDAFLSLELLFLCHIVRMYITSLTIWQFPRCFFSTMSLPRNSGFIIPLVLYFHISLQSKMHKISTSSSCQVGTFPLSYYLSFQK